MQEAGFFAQKRRSPIGLSGVILAHAAVLGALVLIKGPQIIRNDPVITKINPIEIPQDPPPEPQVEPRNDPAPRPIERMTTVLPPIERPILGPITPPSPPQPPDPLPPLELASRTEFPPAPSTVPPQRARANLGAYFSTDDYPAAAIRAEAEGTTRFTLAIGPDGRVTGCSVTGSSGNSALDNATCRILRGRARYAAARDRNGHPISGQDRGSVTWRLPSE